MKTCTGDCLQCPAQQRVYCAAQMSRNAIESLTRVERRLEEIEDKLNSLEKEEEEELFNPTKKAVESKEEEEEVEE